jgi:hypothetical protein
LYNPTNGTWSSANSLNVARQSPTVTVLQNGEVLVAGGSGGGLLTSAELYNPTNGSWTLTQPLKTTHWQGAVALLTNGQVLLAGGVTNVSGGGASTAAELFNPTNRTWSLTGTMTQAREGFTLTLLANGRVLATGGLGTNGVLTSAEVFDPGTGLWTATGSLNTNRAFHTATLLPSGKILVTGGLIISNGFGFCTPSVELYNPGTGTWTLANPMNQPRSGHTASLLPDGKVLVAGGDNSDSYTTVAEIYDPTAGTWTTTVPLAVGREDPAMVVLHNGTVLIAGGFNLERIAAGNEGIYNPASLAAAPTRLTGASKPLNAAFQFTFTNSPGAMFNVFTTTNASQPIINWTDLGGVVEISPGHYEFTDPGSTGSPLGFYSVSSP